MFFLGALYLRRVLGYDALQIGLAFLPVTITMGTLSIRYSERLVTRFGARNLLVPGLALIALALVLFALAPVHGSYFVHVLPSMLLLGIGAGICFPALMNVAMSGVDAAGRRPRLGARQHHRAGRRRARAGGARDAVGVAQPRTCCAQGHSNAAALTGGYHLAFWIAAALTAAAIAVVPVVLRAPPAPIDVPAPAAV